jgi:flagellar biosynthesis GTPase FlhF
MQVRANYRKAAKEQRKAVEDEVKRTKNDAKQAEQKAKADTQRCEEQDKADIKWAEEQAKTFAKREQAEAKAVAKREYNEAKRESPEEALQKAERKVQNKAARKELWRDITCGSVNPKIECRQCRHTGAVRVKQITQKAGISGGKATGALLTGGVSLLATGLSRKQQVTQARCDNCGSNWFF